MAMHIKLTFLFFAVAIVAAPARADRIRLRDGKEVAGKIQKESPTEVVIQGTATTQTVSVHQIADVHYDNQPATMIQAKSAEEDAYNLAGAADLFAKAQSEAKGNAAVQLAAQFGEARSRAKLAIDDGTGIPEAIARLESFERTNAETRHHFAAQELLGRLNFHKKDYARAAAAFNALAAAPWPEAKLQADVYHGRILVAQGKLDEAIARFDQVLAGKPASPEQDLIQTESLVHKATCYRQQKKFDDEVATLQKVVERAPPGAIAVQAEAYAALGDALRTSGKTKDALFAFLHVELIFPRDKELHARALYNLSQLWTELDRSDRAADARDRLKADYPNSTWAKTLGS